MKKIIFYFLLLFPIIGFSQIGINTTNPNASSILDISSTNKGLLIPRVQLTGVNDVSTIPSPALSLLVFKSNASQAMPTGFYYWNGTRWTPLIGSGTGSGANDQWLLNGNSVTSSNFLGTTNWQPLVFKVNNVQTAKFVPNGGIAIGIDAAANDNQGVAIGKNALANVGNEATAVGTMTTASGYRSVAMGFEAQSTNNHSLALGNKAKATALDAVAIGTEAMTPGKGSVALGFQASTNGEFATAIGQQSLAGNHNAVAIGNIAKATGQFGTALGNNTVAGGYESAAVGSNSEASGQGAMAFGFKNKSEGYESTTLGAYNRTTGQSTLAAGFQNDIVGFQSMALGAFNSITQGRGLAVGYKNIVSAEDAMAIGNNSRASGQYAMAIGRNATASMPSTLILGNNLPPSDYNGTRVGIGTSTPNANVKLDVDDNVKLGKKGSVIRGISSFQTEVSFSGSGGIIEINIPSELCPSSTVATITATMINSIADNFYILWVKMLDTTKIRLKYKSEEVLTISTGKLYITITEFIP